MLKRPSPPSVLERFIRRYRWLEEMCYHAGRDDSPPRARRKRSGHPPENARTMLLLRKVDLDRELASLLARYLDDI